LIHMALQFRTAFIAPSSRVFGRGELVVDPHKIAMRYLKKDFWLDFVALLPLPQVLPNSQLCGFVFIRFRWAF
jgi:cyclic nucleotide gated channel